MFSLFKDGVDMDEDVVPDAEVEQVMGVGVAVDPANRTIQSHRVIHRVTFTLIYSTWRWSEHRQVPGANRF